MFSPPRHLFFFFFLNLFRCRRVGPTNREQGWPIPFLTLWGHLPSGNSLPPSVFLLFLFKKKKKRIKNNQRKEKKEP